MKVKFFRKGRQCSPAMLSKIASLAGIELPDDYCEFMKDHSGAEFDIHKISSPISNESLAIAQILPARDVLYIGRKPEFSARRLLPFASAGRHNFFAFDTENDFRVVLFRHGDGTNVPLLVAESFTGLLDAMEPITVDEIPLPQNAAVWVNPNLAAEAMELLRKYGKN
jgi:hypothetical protein